MTTYLHASPHCPNSFPTTHWNVRILPAFCPVSVFKTVAAYLGCATPVKFPLKVDPDTVIIRNIPSKVHDQITGPFTNSHYAL